VSTDEPGDGEGGKPHGVVRGSSLPYDRNDGGTEQPSSRAGKADSDGSSGGRGADATDVTRPVETGPKPDDGNNNGEPKADDGNADGNGGTLGRTMDDAEFRLTMIDSVREAVNRICEQAVEKTAAIVKSGRGYPNATTPSGVRDAADDSEAADYASSEFSLPPPPPPLPPTDPVSAPLPPTEFRRTTYESNILLRFSAFFFLTL